MSSFDPIWLLRAMMGAVLVLGTLIAYFGLSAWRRSRSRPMLFMGAGFVLVSLAAALSGLIYEVLTQNLLTAWTVSAALSAIGFGTILYSLLLREREDLPASPPAALSPGFEGSPQGPPR